MEQEFPQKRSWHSIGGGVLIGIVSQLDRILNWFERAMGWGGGGVAGDTEGFVENVTDAIGSVPQINNATVQNGLLLLGLAMVAYGVFPTLAVVIDRKLSWLERWALAAIEWVLGSRDTYFRRYYSFGVVSAVLAMCIGVFGMEAESRGATLGWAALAAVLAFFAVLMMSSSGSPSKETAKTASAKPVAVLENDSLSRKRLEEYLTILKREGDEAIRAWRNNEIPFEEAQPKSKFWFMQLHGALNSSLYDFYPRFNQAVNTHKAAVPLDELFKVKLDNSHQDNVCLYQTWQSRLNVLPEFIGELNDGTQIETELPSWDLATGITPERQQLGEDLSAQVNELRENLANLENHGEKIQALEEQLGAANEATEKTQDETKKANQRAEGLEIERDNAYQQVKINNYTAWAERDYQAALAKTDPNKNELARAFDACHVVLNVRMNNRIDGQPAYKDWLLSLDLDLKLIKSKLQLATGQNSWDPFARDYLPQTWELKQYAGASDDEHNRQLNLIAYRKQLLTEAAAKYLEQESSSK